MTVRIQASPVDPARKSLNMHTPLSSISKVKSQDPLSAMESSTAVSSVIIRCVTNQRNRYRTFAMSASNQRRAPVNEQFTPGHEAAVVGSEEHRRTDAIGCCRPTGQTAVLRGQGRGAPEAHNIVELLQLAKVIGSTPCLYSKLPGQRFGATAVSERS